MAAASPRYDTFTGRPSSRCCRGAGAATLNSTLSGRISFSNNAPDAALQAGAQDRLSVLLQLGAMLAADPDLVDAIDPARFSRKRWAAPELS